MANRILPAETLNPPKGMAQVVKFGLVGVSNTLVDAAVYFSLSSGVLVLVLPRLVAKAAGYFAGIVNSYYWNRRWTFRSDRSAGKTFPPFFLTNLAGMGVNVLLLDVLLEVFRLEELAAVAAATAGAAIWNFLINKFVVFRKSGELANVDIHAR